jgi:BASS family bile acid:Na+ symporter
MIIRKYYPIASTKLSAPLRYSGMLILASFIIVGLWQHRGLISSILPLVFLPVLFHNALAFTTGHFAGTIAGLRKREIRTITIETGIQNSGLALIIIFGFFDGQQEMAAVAAWWGIWHMIAGTALTIWYNYRDRINPE